MKAEANLSAEATREINTNSPIKLLYVAAYEPYSKPPSYVSIFSIRTNRLLTCLQPIDMATMEEHASKEAERYLDTTNNSFWETGKFCELAAANSLKTAELLCTPQEFIKYSQPEWSKLMSGLWGSGVLLSIRLSKKCVEVAKKALKGEHVDSDEVKYQIWRLATIVAAHLATKKIDIAFPGTFS